MKSFFVCDAFLLCLMITLLLINVWQDRDDAFADEVNTRDESGSVASFVDVHFELAPSETKPMTRYDFSFELFFRKLGFRTTVTVMKHFHDNYSKPSI